MAVLIESKFKLLLKIASISSCLAVAYYTRLVLLPKSVRVHNSVFFSQKIREKINSLISEKKLSELHADKIFHELQNLQEGIEEVQIVYRPTKTAHLFVHASRPVIIVKDIRKNTEYIVAQNRSVVARDLYAPEVLEDLPTVYIDSEELRAELKSPEFFSFIHALTPELYLAYTIIWKSKIEIVLQTKQSRQTKLTLVGCAQTASNLELINYAERIAAQKNRDAKKGAQNQGIKIDLRFKEMLICAPGDGGNK